MDFQGKTATATGPDREFHAAIALHLAGRGEHVVVADIGDCASAMNAAMKIPSTLGSACAFEVDVAQARSVRRLVNYAVKELIGNLDPDAIEAVAELQLIGRLGTPLRGRPGARLLPFIKPGELHNWRLPPDCRWINGKMISQRPVQSQKRGAAESVAGREMIQIKASNHSFDQGDPMWNSIASAPSGPSLQLAVFDEDGMHVLVFPCRKEPVGWKNAATGARVDVHPTHWRPWDPEKSDWDPVRN